jgi:hypothetical protein
MKTKRRSCVVVAALSVLALNAMAVGPVPAVSPDPGLTLKGLHTPVGIDIDPVDGTVYVANAEGGEAYSVSVFDAGQAYPNNERTLIGVPAAFDVAVNPADRWIYVSSPNTDMVVAYRSGATEPVFGIGADHPAGLDFSADGSLLFVALFESNKVAVYERTEHGDYSFHTSLTTLAQPTDVAVNPILGGLYVSSAAGDVEYFDNFAPPAVEGRKLTGGVSAWSVAFNPVGGQMFVTDPASDVVRSYAVGIVTPDATGELTGSPDAFGVAVLPRTGQIYVSDATANEVRTYPPPAATITSLVPPIGPVVGGTEVCVNGTNLRLVTSVVFGGGSTSDFTAANTRTKVCVRNPAATTAGPVDVSVKWDTFGGTASGAFTYTAVAPRKATGVSGAPGKGQVTVSWTPPSDTGGVPVASYTVTPTPAGPACATTATYCTIAGLTNGTKYRFMVRTTNTANLSSDSDASAEVTPYIPLTQKVKAKKASSKLPRKGFTTVVNWVKKPSYSSRVMTVTCTDGTGRSSGKLCRIYTYRTGKVKVRTKGYRNVTLTITVHVIPKAGAPAQYGPSAMWTRTWRVR